MSGASNAPPLGDCGALSRWMRRHLPQWQDPVTATAITGGQSNLTYKVQDADGRLCVVRRPPPGERLSTAHDVAREYFVLDALCDNSIPVPPVIGFSDDITIIGAPFYAMHHIDGVVLRTEPEATTALTEQSRTYAGEQLVDTLVALHAIDPAQNGLDSLGASSGYVRRQLTRWHLQWERSRTTPIPAIELVGRRLAERIPLEGSPRIVHGDYRLDNVILDPTTGAIRAVLDWELCTTGDPLADLGLLAVYSPDRRSDNPLATLGVATLATGFLTRDELLERYARRSGRDISDIDYFIALGYWKLAIIVQGVYARSLAANGDIPDRNHALVQLTRDLAEAADAATRQTA